MTDRTSAASARPRFAVLTSCTVTCCESMSANGCTPARFATKSMLSRAFCVITWSRTLESVHIHVQCAARVSWPRQRFVYTNVVCTAHHTHQVISNRSTFSKRRLVRTRRKIPNRCRCHTLQSRKHHWTKQLERLKWKRTINNFLLHSRTCSVTSLHIRTSRVRFDLLTFSVTRQLLALSWVIFQVLMQCYCYLTASSKTCMHAIDNSMLQVYRHFLCRTELTSLYCLVYQSCNGACMARHRAELFKHIV